MKIMDAVTKANVTLKKVSTTKGGEYAGACPWCGGRDRFRVWPNKDGEGSYWCRQCKRSGDLVQFLVDFFGMEYPKAFMEAGREQQQIYRPNRYRPFFGKNSNMKGKESKFTPRHYDDPIAAWEIRAANLVDESHINLLENVKVRGWLADRGLDIEAVKRFRLGWFPGENGKPYMFRPRSVWGLPDIKKENGQAKMLWVPRGIIIPWIADGKVRRIKIRRPISDLHHERDVKYYFLPGSSPEPSLLCTDRKAFVVVESELDGLLIIHRAGDFVGCLVLGSAGNKPGHEAYQIMKASIRILDALDYDQAGAIAGKWWRTEFHQVKRWPIPLGKDPGEAFTAGVDILEWILAGLPPGLK